MFNLCSAEILRTAIMKFWVLASNNFTLLSALNNHIAFKFGESEHDVTYKFTSRRVVDDAHVDNIDSNSLTIERFDELDAVNDTTSDSV